MTIKSFAVWAAFFFLFSVLINIHNPAVAGDRLQLKAGVISTKNLPYRASIVSNPDKRYFVVQFKDKITEANKGALIQQGLEPKMYLPDDALLVSGSARDAEVARLAFDVQAVVPFIAEWKISRELFTSGHSSKSASQSASNLQNELIVISTIDPSETASIARRLARIPGVELRSARAQQVIVSADRGLVQEMARIEGVAWIQSMPVFTPFDYMIESESMSAPISPSALTYSGFESGTQLMNMDAAWKRGFKGQGQIVGMSDTGVDTGDLRSLHQDLGNVIKGFPFGMGSESWEDPQAHGTHVTGSVVGTGRLSDGNIRGAAYSARFIVESLWSPVVDNISFNPDFDKLFGTAYEEGARVHTNSWGSPRYLGSYDSFAAKVDTFLWNNPDMLVLFAAGNSGEDTNQDGRIDEGSISSPGTAKNVLTVGASENLISEGGIQKQLVDLKGGDKKWGVEPLRSDHLSDHANGIACFSSVGPTEDGRLKPEIVAPGTNIVSARSRHPKATKLWGEFGSDYLWAGGTSMATPLTAGAAAVVREYLIKARELKTPSGALIKTVLMHTAKDLYPGQYETGPQQEFTTKRPNHHEGYGRVDMDLATSLGSETLIIDDRAGVALNEEKHTTVSLRKGGSLRVTMSYTDAPGLTSAAKALVNDLDIQVVAPNGDVHQLKDRVNNSEMLELDDLAKGDYKVVVKGINIPQGKQGRQPFAALISVNN